MMWKITPLSAPLPIKTWNFPILYLLFYFLTPSRSSNGLYKFMSPNGAGFVLDIDQISWISKYNLIFFFKKVMSADIF